MGIKGELNPAREMREGFLEEVTPGPKFEVSQVRVGGGTPDGRSM